jgi:hypothetical protein
MMVDFDGFVDIVYYKDRAVSYAKVSAAVKVWP